MRIATYNIRFDNPGDAPNHWDNRKEVVANLIKFHGFDIFGTQEGLHHQVEYLKKHLPQFEYVGVARDDGRQKGEYSAVFYNKEKFKLLESNTFWLSTDTSKPNIGWDAALPRICTWAKLKDINNGNQFFVFNTHFDHVGTAARQKSAQLILNKIKEYSQNGLPVMLLGDFNVDQENPAYYLLENSSELKDCFNAAQLRYANNGTFNSFDISKSSDRRIDHIFVSESVKVKKYGILTDTYHNRYPSDHFPVMAEIELRY
ncbi:endonuclease/exonuclease/phosphatase family protein [Echinicola jeungdonensis]|uniref:Endonuclease/exonuclease/phosphatase family protein n=1 Tax=Echinicola jeungdonensis TaxID=709343 RepID=A0ABV5J988_9BACT|nr:endonuclease/exonuclease/phosphatase family protein [Echinicola jeungdonensis]MDN3670505.1 endonuclease/exonuclease/phosphatase family protein [Echinicola jeungdonensis]